MYAALQVDGNDYFSINNSAITKNDVFSYINTYLNTIHRARILATKFDANPIWTFKAFDDEEQKTADQLFEMYFESGWKKARPKCRLSMNCAREGFNWDLITKRDTPTDLRLCSTYTFSLLGEHITTEKVVLDYRQGIITVTDPQPRIQPTSKKRKSNNKQSPINAPDDDVRVLFTGTPSTEVEMRLATPEDEATDSQ